MVTFITYTGPDEVLVTTPDQEKACLKEWFAKGLGRNLEEDYDRVEHTNEAVNISTSLSVSQYG